jgi:high-affinity nickel permease
MEDAEDTAVAMLRKKLDRVTVAVVCLSVVVALPLGLFLFDVVSEAQARLLGAYWVQLSAIAAAVPALGLVIGGSRVVTHAIFSRYAWDWSAELALRYRVDRTHLDAVVELRGITRPTSRP